MKKNIVFLLSLTMVSLAIIWMKWLEHKGVIQPDKAVWKETSTSDFSKWDTALANFYQHHNLVHPATLVWKEITPDDSASHHRTNIREERNESEE
jgi:hypothetical protein